MLISDNFGGFFPVLSHNDVFVACFLRENEEKSWNVVKTFISLQCQKSTRRQKTKEKFSINNLKIRKEKSYGKDSSYNED
jgi:hypothetical protein